MRDELTRRGFNPLKVIPLWDYLGHSGFAIVEFSKDWTGFKNAIAFEKSFDAEDCEKKDYTSQSANSDLFWGMQLFPNLNKIVLFDDVVVQHEISRLWESNVNGKIMGANINSLRRNGHCPGRKFKDCLNFSEPWNIIKQFDQDRCTWLYGVNVFDLEAWMRHNITATYHQWLKTLSNFST